MTSYRVRMRSGRADRITDKREVCFLIGKGGAILWADASDSPAALPDSRARWEAIWSKRAELEVIAHSHPVGPAAFSVEDNSTMEALDSALGKVMRYMVVAPRVTIVREGATKTEHVVPEPWWAALLRLASGMTATDSDERAGDEPAPTMTDSDKRAGDEPARGKDE
jgi:hypothetical protein